MSDLDDVLRDFSGDDVDVVSDLQVDFEPPVDVRPDPVGIVAGAMVEAVVATRPELVEVAHVIGSVVILVTSPAWIKPVALAWRKRVLGQPIGGVPGENAYERQ